MSAWNDDDKQFVLLARREGRTNAEIASALGRSTNSVETLIGHMRDEGLLIMPAGEPADPAPPQTPFFQRLVASIQARGRSYEQALAEAHAHMAARARRAL